MLIETMQQLIEDVSDPGSQKVAVIFLSRCVTAWGRETNQALPGFDRFIYERLVPTAFRVPSLPGFNAKDGQMMVVSLFHTFVFYCTLNYLFILTHKGSTRNCQFAANCLQSKGYRSVQLFPEHFPTIPKLASRYSIRLYHKIARSGWEVISKVFYRFDSIFARVDFIAFYFVQIVFLLQFYVPR